MLIALSVALIVGVRGVFTVLGSVLQSTVKQAQRATCNGAAGEATLLVFKWHEKYTQVMYGRIIKLLIMITENEWSL